MHLIVYKISLLMCHETNESVHKHTKSDIKNKKLAHPSPHLQKHNREEKKLSPDFGVCMLLLPPLPFMLSVKPSG